MGCCTSSPHSRRRYRDPADLDEEYVPIRSFGTNRVGSNLVPDDIVGLPSTHITSRLPCNPNTILYEAEIDQGKAYRLYRPMALLFCTANGIAYVIAKGIFSVCSECPIDEPCCWLRKEYSTRTFFRIYPNRIMFNKPMMRCPYGPLGCGSWNADHIITHPFDRGAFGFQRVNSLTLEHFCGLWPVYGGVVARQRCQCNGPVWNRMFTDCGGWWCDEWICKIMCCAYRYDGLANPDEVAFACAIALQAYFEGRTINADDMQVCLEYWNNHISEQSQPTNRKRPVCCEPFCFPMPTFHLGYRCTHHCRRNPYPPNMETSELREVYDKYDVDRKRQINRFESYFGPVHYSTFCQLMGCRRFCGRKGFLFCCEGCYRCWHCNREAGAPAPPFEVPDLDDEWDASTILLKVLGPPPRNVAIRRWRWDKEKEQHYLDVYPPSHSGDDGDDKAELIIEKTAHDKDEQPSADVDVELAQIGLMQSLSSETEHQFSAFPTIETSERVDTHQSTKVLPDA